MTDLWIRPWKSNTMHHSSDNPCQHVTNDPRVQTQAHANSVTPLLHHSTVLTNAGYSHSSQRANIRCSHHTKLRIHSHSAEGADLSTLTAIFSNSSHTECAHTEDPCSCSLSGYWSLSSLQPNSCSIHAHVWRNIRSHYSHAQASVRMPPNGTNVRILNYSLTPLVNIHSNVTSLVAHISNNR